MDFLHFLNEVEKRKGEAKKLIILTVRPATKDQIRTAEKLQKIAEKAGLESYVVYSEEAFIRDDGEGTRSIHNLDDEKGFKIDPSDTIVMIRASVLKHLASMDLISQLERARFYCVNSRKCIEICADKYRTYINLKQHKIEAPKTTLVRGISGLDIALKEVGGKFPVILKTLRGTQGVGVFQIDSMNSLKSVLQTLWKLAPEQEIIMQEFIETDGDYRVHVLGNTVLTAMKRHKVKGDFRANVHLGAEVSSADDLDEEVKELAINANKSVGGIWTGVDIIIEKGTNRKVVIEVNSSPGTDGIEKATKRPVSKEVFDYVKVKANWQLPTMESGFIESIYVDELGEYIIAKLDTGNGSLCSIHAEKYDVDEKKKTVTWWHHGKKYTTPYMGTKKIKVGGLKTLDQERPVTSLTFKFNGETFEDFRVALSDRDVRSPLLINRTFIKLAGLSINPHQKYLLSVEREDTHVKHS